MGRGEPVSLAVLGRICEKLNCKIGDLVEFVREDKNYEGRMLQLVLCFAALLRVLKCCLKPKISNKVLCGTLVKVINEQYGDMLETTTGE